MKAINDQIERLRIKFNTKNILNETTETSLSQQQLDTVKRIIRLNKSDGYYEVDKKLVVQLKQGKCYIKYNI